MADTQETTQVQPEVAEPYTWTQTLPDCSVTVPIPADVRARDLVVEIKKEHLLVKLKRDPKPLIDGKLHKPVKAQECFWNVEESKSGKAIIVDLQKENAMEWWKSIIQGHKEIDTTKIEPENSKLSDLDGDTRTMVEKMMFDQQQKALGRPTSDELQKQETLKKFMSQHPEMDFSNAKMM